MATYFSKSENVITVNWMISITVLSIEGCYRLVFHTDKLPKLIGLEEYYCDF
jgi:hypothetical protein